MTQLSGFIVGSSAYGMPASITTSFEPFQPTKSRSEPGQYGSLPGPHLNGFSCDAKTVQLLPSSLGSTFEPFGPEKWKLYGLSGVRRSQNERIAQLPSVVVSGW